MISAYIEKDSGGDIYINNSSTVIFKTPFLQYIAHQNRSVIFKIINTFNVCDIKKIVVFLFLKYCSFTEKKNKISSV